MHTEIPRKRRVGSSYPHGEGLRSNLRDWENERLGRWDSHHIRERDERPCERDVGVRERTSARDSGRGGGSGGRRLGGGDRLVLRGSRFGRGLLWRLRIAWSGFVVWLLGL